MELVKPVQTRYQIQELISRWSELFGSISSTTLLQLAKDGKFNLYVSNTGCRRCNLFTKHSLGRPSRKIEAYLNSEYINLHDFQIHTLLAGEQTTITMLKVDELKESDFIPGDEPFNLSIIEAAVIDEKERIVIKPDDIKYLSVTSEDVLAFEQELMDRSVRQQSKLDKRNPEPQSEVINGNDTAKASKTGTKGRRNKQIEAIIEKVKDFEYDHDPLNIPYGGVAKIEKECLKNTGLFTESGFKRAWMEAGKRGLIRVKNKEKYLGS